MSTADIKLVDMGVDIWEKDQSLLSTTLEKLIDTLEANFAIFHSADNIAEFAAEFYTAAFAGYLANLCDRDAVDQKSQLDGYAEMQQDQKNFIQRGSYDILVILETSMIDLYRQILRETSAENKLTVFSSLAYILVCATGIFARIAPKLVITRPGYVPQPKPRVKKQKKSSGLTVIMPERAEVNAMIAAGELAEC